MIRLFAIFVVLILAGCTKILNQPKNYEYVHPTPHPVQPTDYQPLPDNRYEQPLQPVAEQPLEPVMGGYGKVGVLIPLTGPAANAGKAIKDALTLAVQDNPNTQIEFLVYDTKSTKQGAMQAASQAVAQEVQLILGPLYSNSASDVANIAWQRGINVITFSNDKNIAGNNLFVFGLIPDRQITRVVEYATAQGIDSFAALLPEDKFGETIDYTLQEAAAKNMADVTATQTYPADYPVFSTKAKKLVRKMPRKRGVNRVGFVFPESGKRIAKTAKALQVLGVDNKNTRFIGSYLWDTPEVANNPALRGAWFAGPPAEASNELLTRFEEAHGYRPSNLATLGYDAGTLAIELANKSWFDQASIADSYGYRGINGQYKFGYDNIVQRKLAINEVRNGYIATIDYPQEGFGDELYYGDSSYQQQYLPQPVQVQKYGQYN